MSDVIKLAGISLESINLLPKEILTLPKFNVRPFAPDTTEEEDRRIEELAIGMEQIGQLDAVLITPTHVCIAGHRRRKAAMVINERRAARGQSLFRLRCSIDHDDNGDLRRKGIISNLHRKDNSPMDLAYLIAQIREERGWRGYKDIQQVAEYFGVSFATIVQHEKLLGVEKELQNQIHAGILSVKSAQDLIKSVRDAVSRGEVIARAAEIQNEDALDKALEDCASHKKTVIQTAAAINRNPKVRIEHPSIVKAIRERHVITPTTHEKRLPLGRAELIHAITQLDVDGVSESARSFARYFVNQFATGQGSFEDLRQRFVRIGPDDLQAPYSQQLLHNS